MTMKQNVHALNVVNSFKAKLPEGLIETIGNNHFDELSLLIESAISSAVLEESERTADKIEKLAHEVRHCAEHFDN